MKKLIFIIFLLYFIPAVSLAADMFFDGDKNNFAQNEYFSVEVFIDTKDSKINALEGTIIFPPSLLEFKEVRDGNSAINFWMERPHSAKDGEIVFSGITAGGFSGEKRFLFGLVFRSKKTGAGSISFSNIQALQNDGLGTKISIKKIPFGFAVSDKFADSTAGDLTIEDKNPPEDFTPFIGSDPSIFDGQYFLTWSAVDKGTGIDHYEVLESFWGFGDYIVTESPYLLKDQTLKKSIYIKAVDKAQNEKIAKLGAQNKLGLLIQLFIYSIILFICIFLFKKIWQRFTIQ